MLGRRLRGARQQVAAERGRQRAIFVKQFGIPGVPRHLRNTLFLVVLFVDIDGRLAAVQRRLFASCFFSFSVNRRHRFETSTGLLELKNS